MPFTPFIGISTFVHLMVILWNKLRERFLTLPAAAAPRKSSERKIMLCVFGSFIILTIFSYVIVGAATLLYVSVSEEHSTAHLAPYVWLALVALTTTLIPQAALALAALSSLNILPILGVLAFVIVCLSLIPRAPYRYASNLIGFDTDIFPSSIRTALAIVGVVAILGTGMVFTSGFGKMTDELMPFPIHLVRGNVG